MFQRNKNSYKITATCKKGEKKGQYTFIDGPDDNWGETASNKFKNEFGETPTHCHLVSREKL